MPVEYVVNPDISLIDEIDNEMLILNGWSRVQKTMDISYAGLDGFTVIMAVDTDTKKPVGLISLAKDYPADGNEEDVLWYIGSFYVSGEYRLQGIGKELGMRAVAYTKGANTTMNGTLELVEQYKANGFPLCRDFRQGYTSIETKNIHPRPGTDPKGFEIKSLDQVDFHIVEQYDQKICNRNRAKYLQLWMTLPPGGKTKVAVDLVTGKSVGFCCVNPQYTNRIIAGPFYAESEDIAQELLHSTLAEIKLSNYSRLIFKFPEANGALPKILRTITSEQFEISANGLTMFSHRVLPTDHTKIFGFTETAHSFV